MSGFRICTGVFRDLVTDPSYKVLNEPMQLRNSYRNKKELSLQALYL